MKIKDVVKLDNGEEYVVASKALFSNDIYYFLTNINDVTDVLICREDNGELVEINDTLLNSKLLPIFFENSKDVLN